MQPGRELDALIAEKVMGWQMNQMPAIEVGRDLYAVTDVYGDEKGDFKILPKYSTDISAAWEVVEKFEVVEILKGEDSAHCRIRIGKGHPAYEAGDDWITDESITSSVPHAICLAALKAIEFSG